MPRHALPDSLGDHLRRRRDELGLSQAAAGARMGVARETVGDWELGVVQPSLALVPRMHEFLGYCPVDLTEIDVGRRLRRRRTAQGSSLDTAAAQIGVNRKTLARLEHSTPHDPVSPRVAAAIDAHLVAPESDDAQTQEP